MVPGMGLDRSDDDESTQLSFLDTLTPLNTPITLLMGNSGLEKRVRRHWQTALFLRLFHCIGSARELTLELCSSASRTISMVLDPK